MMYRALHRVLTFRYISTSSECIRGDAKVVQISSITRVTKTTVRKIHCLSQYVQQPFPSVSKDLHDGHLRHS